MTDAQGNAGFDFRVGWGSAFFIFPPIGSVPWRPAKPDYWMSEGNQARIVTPNTSGAVYRWRKGSWQTIVTWNDL